MNRYLLKLTIVSAVLQAVLAVLATRWPDWFSTYLLSDTSTYSQFLNGYNLVETLVIISVVLFLLQILFFIRYFNLSFAVLAFHFVYLCMRRDYIVATIILLVCVFWSTLLGFALQGLSAYARSAAIQFKYHELINRGWRIEQANLSEPLRGSPYAVEQYQTALDIYSDSRDAKLQDRVTKTNDIVSISKELTKRGEHFLSSGNTRLAIQFFRTASEVYQLNEAAKKHLDELQKDYDASQPVAVSFYNACRQGDAELLENNADLYAIFIRDKNVLSSLHSKPNPLVVSRVLRQLCYDPMKYKTPQSFMKHYGEFLFDRRDSRWSQITDTAEWLRHDE